MSFALKMIIKILLVFAVTVFAFSYGNDGTSLNLWDHVVKMEQVILNVEYNERRLSVWKEEVHGYNRFFVTPTCIMETSTLKCGKNKYSNSERFALSFYVQLWDFDAAKVVQVALKQKGFEAEASDIIPLPMQMVKLSINNVLLSPQIKLDNNKWKPHQDQKNRIRFELGLENQTFCNEMETHAKSDPEDFLEELKLFFTFTMVVNSQASRSLNITGKTIANSKMFANLENNYSNQTTGIAYLQSEDVNNLAKDIYHTFTISDEITSDYIEPEKEDQFIRELFNEIKGDIIESADLSIDQWNSVFWDDIFSRPDVQTEYFNDTLTYDSGAQQFKYDEAKENDFRERTENRFTKEKYRKTGGGVGFSFLGIGANAALAVETGEREGNEVNVDTGSKNVTTISRDDLESFIKSKKANVKWTGTKFEPKSLALQRINTNNLKSSGQILYRKVITTKLATTQELQIQAEPKYASNNNKAVGLLYFEALENAITNITTKFDAQMEYRDAQFHELLRQTNERINVSRKVISLITNKTRNRDAHFQELLRQTNEKINASREDVEIITKKISPLYECVNVNVVYGKNGYGSNENVTRLISAIGDGLKKPFEKNYVRLVHYMGEPILITLKCSSNFGTLETVILKDGGEMAFEFTDCPWSKSSFWCNVTTNNFGKHKNFEVYSPDSQNKAHNWSLFNDVIYKGHHNSDQREKAFDWDR